MLHYITGRPGSGKSEYLLTRLKIALDAGKSVILLVPEQQTVLWESRLAEELPLACQLQLEVTNFTRLANTVFRQYGGLAKSRIDDGGRTLVLWRAMLSVWDMLQVYNHGADGREDKSLPSLAAAIGELKRNRVTPAALESAAAVLAEDDGAAGFAGRLGDVSLIYAAYEEMLHVEYADRDDVMDALVQTLESHPFFAGKTVFADSFYSVTPPELRILRCAAADAEDLWVSFACDREDTGELPFLRIRKFLQQMERTAADLGLLPECISLPGDMRHSTAGLRAITAGLFRYDGAVQAAMGDKQDPADGEPLSAAGCQTSTDHSTDIDCQAAAEHPTGTDCQASAEHFTGTDCHTTAEHLTGMDCHTAAEHPIGTDCQAAAEHPTGTDCHTTTDDVTVYQCADRYEEAEAVAALIEQKVRGGCRYRDIAVVSRRMDSLRGILDTALVRHGIPCFLAEADPLSSSPAVRLLLSLLSVEAHGFDRRDLVRMIATGLTPVTAEEGDCFAMYTETWNIRGRTMFCGDGTAAEGKTAPAMPVSGTSADGTSSFGMPSSGTSADGTSTFGMPACGTSMFGWSWNPDGYRTEVSPWGKICLREANRARDKLLPPVAAFCDIFTSLPDADGKKQPRTAPVTDICRGLVTFAGQIGLYDRLMEQSEAQRRAGRREESAKTALVWEQICAALDKMAVLLGDISLDAGRFSGLFSRVIASMDIGAIPTAVDEVLLGSADGIRFGQVDHVILVGAVEGEFPADVSDAGFFRDSDRILLEGAGVNLAGSSEEYLAEEYWMFYRTAASAAKSLTVLCPRTSAGEACIPSPGVERILHLTGRNPVLWGELPACKRIFHPAARTEDPALSAWLREQTDCTAAYYPGLMDASGDHADPACIGAYFGDRMRLTQSRLDSFSACPFRYWCQYGMSLQEAPHAAITAPDIGSFVHAILEQFFRETAGRDYPLPREETEEIAGRLVQGYLVRLGVEQSGRLGYLFVRLRRSVSVFLEAIMEEYGQGRFVPMAFELPVGLPSEDPDAPRIRPVTIETEGGVQVTLSGVIDRVDRYTADDGREYVRVVDYKTGARTFSLSDIRQGMHVQLLLYLFSLWQGGLRTGTDAPPTELLPAGAVYFQVRPGETASDAMLTPEEARQRAIDNITRSGIWLRDEEVLEAMDAGLTGKYVPVTRKKDGSLTGRATLQDLAQFGALYEELRGIIGKIAGEMHEGRSAAAPRMNSWGRECGYCPFGAVCRVK